MKHFLPLFLIFLLLCGCTKEHSPAESTSLPQTEPSETSAEPDGIVCHSLPRSAYFDLRIMGEQLLLLSSEGARTRLSVFSPKSGLSEADTAIDDSLIQEQGTLQAGAYGVVYYSRSQGCLIFLDSGLKETHRVFAPDQTRGIMVPASDAQTAYYSDGTCISRVDLSTGLTTLLSDSSGNTLLGSLFDGKVLALSDDKGNDIFLRVSDGTSVRLEGGCMDLISDGGCAVSVPDSPDREILIQSPGSPVWKLDCPAECIFPISSLHAVAAVVSNSKETSVLLWDQADGSGLGRFSLQGSLSVSAFAYDDSSSRLWLIASDQHGEFSLYGIPASEMIFEAPDSAYLPYYSAETPDHSGLQRIQAKLDSSSEGKCYEIVVNEPGYSFVFDSYLLTNAYQTTSLEPAAEAILSVLLGLPEGLLESCTDGTVDGMIHFGLYEAVSSKNTLGCPGPVAHSDGKYLVALSAEDPEGSLYHALGHLMNNRILSTGNWLDNWEDDNPFYFSYSCSMDSELLDEGYLEEGSRFFPSLLSMTFPAEDRAEILRFATKEGAESLFSDPAMQDKLLCLCQAIRSSFSLNAFPDPLPWEQYLSAPIIPGS